MTVRWTFYEPVEAETYSFAVNPSDGGSPNYTKNVKASAPGGSVLILEAADRSQTIEFTGVILTQAHYDALHTWWDKRTPVMLTDDLGREFWIYIETFSPKRQRQAGYPWKHTYTVTAPVISSDQIEPTLTTPDRIAGLAMWLDAGHLPLSDGDAVTTWTDSIGSGFNPTQATAAQKPTFKTDIVNGLPVLRFDGGDLLRHAVANAWSTILAGTVFAVLRPRTSHTGTILCSADEASTTRYMSFDVVTNSQQVTQRSNDTAGVIADAADNIETTGFSLVCWGSTGAAYRGFVDGASWTPTVLGGANNGDWFGDTVNRDNVVVGAFKTSAESQFFDGDIAEILVYSVDLTAADRDTVELYLADKYALVVT